MGLTVHGPFLKIECFLHKAGSHDSRSQSSGTGFRFPRGAVGGGGMSATSGIRPATSGPVRLTTRTALGLWLPAMRDRRAGLPALGDPTTVPPPTPCVQELDRQRLESIECERARLIADTAAARVAFQKLETRIGQAEAALSTALSAVPRVDADSAVPAATGPVARTDRVARCQVRLGELRTVRAELQEQIATQCVTAQSRAVRVDEYLRRCCARYARTLLRRHPDGPALARLGWPALGELPTWVREPRPAAALFPAAGDLPTSAGAPPERVRLTQGVH